MRTVHDQQNTEGFHGNTGSPVEALFNKAAQFLQHCSVCWEQQWTIRVQVRDNDHHKLFSPAYQGGITAERNNPQIPVTYLKIEFVSHLTLKCRSMDGLCSTQSLRYPRSFYLVSPAGLLSSLHSSNGCSKNARIRHGRP